MGNFGVFTYLLFPENCNVKAFETKMQEMYTRYMKPIFGPINIKIEYILEPITRIHLYSTNANEPEPTGSITYVYIFAIVALFLVLIAAMNYMNLATARSTRSRLIARQTALIGEARRFDGLPLPPDAARKMLLLKLGIGLPAPADPVLRAETTQKAAELDAAYGRGKYCPDSNPDHCLGIDDIDVKMAQSHDPKELAALWPAGTLSASPCVATMRAWPS